MPANTYTLIEKITVGAAGASSITFTSIPQTYTDLKIVASVRSDRASSINSFMRLYPNGSSTGITLIALTGNGSSAGSQTQAAASAYVGEINAITSTTSTFSSVDIYIPNYTASTNKSYSVDAVMENNATTAYAALVADLWSNTSAITSLQLLDALGNFVQYSTFYLYGIAKEGVSPSPSSAPYATGGDSIVFDGTYWIHTFTSSGTFTPKKSLTCDYLVVAGGGGGGSRFGGGGGAGGFQTFTSQSLTATGYTVTVGAGGAGGVATGSSGTGGAGDGTNGSNSQFGSLTASVGGGGGGAGNSNNGLSGGSGGGGAGRFASSGGTATSGQGNNGGAAAGDSLGGDNYRGGGGGGAGAVGGAGSTPGTGGNGSSNSYSGSAVTYAGGGGGAGGALTATGAAGGTGGGGAGGNYNQAGTAGTVNLGGGGGGGGYNGNVQPGVNYAGGAGGSGIVIVRYAA